MHSARYRQSGPKVQVKQAAQFARQPAKVIEYTVDTVWGAAAYAYRINDGYIGLHQVFATDKQPNRHVAKQVLGNQNLITQQDRDLGSRAREFLAQRLTMKMLKGRISDFDRCLADVVGIVDPMVFRSTDNFGIALVASQFDSYQRAIKELALSDRINHSRGYLANVGATVQANVEVIKAVYSHKQDAYHILGITDTNQAVSFSCLDQYVAGTRLTVTGTVKAHRPDATQLIRVRVL